METNAHMKSKKQPIVVTGAAGFIGLHVCEALLKRGETVIGFDAMTSYNDPKLKKKRLEILQKYKNFIFVKGDIAKGSVFADTVSQYEPRCVVHLAGQAGVRYSLVAPESYIEANVMGSTNVFEVAKSVRIPVVYASSSSIYGNRAGTFKETDRTDTPVSLYAATKKSLEIIASTYHSLYGVPSIGLRFFTVYGPWIRTDLAFFTFTRLLLLGQTIPLFAEGKGFRSFTHISYVVDGMLSAIDRIKEGAKIYNLGDEHSVNTKAFLNLLAKELQVEPQILLMPPQQGDVMKTRASSAKAKKELKVSPRVSLEKGVKEFTKWFLENKKFLLSLQDMHL